MDHSDTGASVDHLYGSDAVAITQGLRCLCLDNRATQTSPFCPVHKQRIDGRTVDLCYEVRDQVKVRYAENVPANMLKAARKRAAAAGVPCTIAVNDIFVPDVCPILGLELKVASGGVPADNSPSLDRRVPDKGYVPGNVAVISYLANRIKSNATPFQLRQIALWVEGGG